MLFVLLLCGVAAVLGTRDDQRRRDARTQCERSSPPWKTAECPRK